VKRRTVALAVAALLIVAVSNCAFTSRGAAGTADAPSAGASAPSSRDAAVQTAVRYVRSTGDVDMYDAGHRRTVLAGLLADPGGEHAAALDWGYETALQGLAQHEGYEDDLVSRNVPVGVDVLRLDAERATVAVWTMSVSGIARPGSTLPVQQVWSTETLELRLTATGWRVLRSASEEGPVPLASPQGPSSSDLLGRLLRAGSEVDSAD
jgi:hypothetical protein